MKQKQKKESKNIMINVKNKTKKMNYLCAYDNNNSSNPWLINIKEDNSIIGPEEKPLTAEYIWNKNEKEREELLNWVFNYFRSKGFPYQSFNDLELKKDYQKVLNTNVDLILDENKIKNSNTSGHNIMKHFCSEKFYASSSGGGLSPLDVFNNDELFKKVLKNRMGWCVSKEGGEERPYVFNITPDMIIQGIRSSSIGSSVSQFKPAVAKFLYSKYCKSGKVFDYSAGWGARLLGAMSLGIEYYGTDPLTYDNLKNMMEYFNGKGKIFSNCSEDKELYKSIPEVDFIFSSPPYFDLEEYSKEENQSYNRNKDYKEWLEKYWKETVINSLGVLSSGGHFGVAIVNKVRTFNIAEDICNICEEVGLKRKDIYPLKTSKSHLSNKAESKDTMKLTDVVYIFKKN